MGGRGPTGRPDRLAWKGRERTLEMETLDVGAARCQPVSGWAGFS